MAEVFLRAVRRGQPRAAVETLDAFGADLPEFRAPEAKAKYAILAGGEPKDEAGRAWQRVVAVVDQLKAAEKLLISCPMWNFGIPYRLKQYFDVIVQPGLTFSYSPEKGYSGLVTGRPAALLLARGGDYSPGTRAAAMDMQKPYLETILRFIGFTDIRTVIAQPTLAAGPDAAEETFRRVSAEVQALADGF
jgi:FMN-dependent NADH-azoreductase